MPEGISNLRCLQKRDDGDGRVDDYGIGGGVKNIVTIVTTVTGSGEQVNGACLREEIAVRQYNPNPLIFLTENTC